MAPDFERRSNRRPEFIHPLFNERNKDGTFKGPSLTHADIARAMLDSPDEGGTLDFSHKNIGNVSEYEAEELAMIGVDEHDGECTVLRVALGYNRLTTLPRTFAFLSRLRYLNLRANSFTLFPDVLTVMPSLEILDISRNKLRRLPSQPGTLLGLRVFSISKNRISRLPSYIAEASNLTVFQIDHNIIEWPPRYVVEPLEKAEDADTMISCIESMKRWIGDNGSGSSTDRAKVPNPLRPPIEESPYRPQHTPSLESDLTSDESDHSSKLSLLHPGPSSASQHVRSHSVESAVSNYSTVSQESSSSDTSFYRDENHELPKYPSPLYQSHIASNYMPSSPSVSPTVSLSPDNSALKAQQHPSGTYHADTSSPSHEDIFLHSQLHGRNASYSIAQQPVSTNTQLVTKKSLPDLRGPVTGRNHMHGSRIPNLPGTKLSITDSGDNDQHHKPPTPYEPHDVSSATSSAPLLPTHSRISRSQPGYNPSRNVVTAEALPSPVTSSPQCPAPSMDVERNSYFRRLSTLPPSTISATIPESLLAMIDSARGILFAVSQIYQSLRHYTVFAIDDRLSGLLGKVLDPASTYMAHLINALDRFDSISRRGVPPPSVCRGVLESCRDNVAVFGKVVGVLHLQLKVLAGFDDARYSRSLLLMLYGSMAEISNSWQTMAPHLDAILPHLSDNRLPLSTVFSSKIHTQTTPSTPMTTRNGISPIPEMQPLISPPIPRTPSSANVPNGRSRMTRRHAGSFSTRDVQIGKTLPSTTEEVPLPSASSPLVVQPLRSALRKPMPSSQVSLLHSQSSSSSSESPSGLMTHSRQGSSSPAKTSGSQSVYQLANLHEDASRMVHSSLEVPSDSSKMVDEDLLATMEAATETARSVWRMMDEVLHTSQENSIELVESLQRGQDITKRLEEKIQAMRGGAVDGDRKAFWEDAHLFVKAVVNVLTTLKAYSVSHPFSGTLRSNIAKLTQSTQDFAILLQVSSFSPAPTPGPYSPAVPGLSQNQGKLSSGGISRSRSAQASQPPPKPKPGELRDTPWSALPHQTFKIHADP